MQAFLKIFGNFLPFRFHYFSPPLNNSPNNTNSLSIFTQWNSTLLKYALGTTLNIGVR
jgi:hypothetical protein